MNYISSACISTYGKAFTKVREVSNAYPGADSPEGYDSDQSADPPEEQPSCSTADQKQYSSKSMDHHLDKIQF